MAVKQRGAFRARHDIADYDITNGARRRLVRFGRLLIEFIQSSDAKTEGLAITGPEPVEAIAIEGEVRELDIADRAAQRVVQGESAIDMVEQAVAHTNVTDACTVAFAEFDSRRGRRKPATVQASVLTSERRLSSASAGVKF